MPAAVEERDVALAISVAAAIRADSRRVGLAITPAASIPLWTPLPGPQTLALETQADELYYGGSGGGGKTDLILGLAFTRHRRTAIFRREYTQLKDMIDRSKEIIKEPRYYNGSTSTWRLPDGRMIEFAGCEHEDDKFKWRGRPHDLYCFDEASEFTESIVTFITAWLRTVDPRQRSRIVYGSNPPASAEGEWIIQRFAPWLDEQHPEPAAPGELRWFAMLDGEDTELENGEPFEWKGETIYPRSRTFLPARLEDNPYLTATPDYRARLQAMPEPFRSQLLFGDHAIGLDDDARQVIPSSWVRAAQARWKPDGRPRGPDGKPIPLSQIGADIAQGGKDATVLARRYGTWFAELESTPGAEIPDAQANADLLLAALAEGGVVSIDADGIGASTYHLLRALVKARARAYLGSAPTIWRDRSDTLAATNIRAAAWWSFREALDPSNEEKIALPPDRQLRADLCAPQFKMLVNGLQIEAKADIKKRLGRSPDRADAVIQAYWQDPGADYAAIIGKVQEMSGYKQSSRKREPSVFGKTRDEMLVAANGRR